MAPPDRARVSGSPLRSILLLLLCFAVSYAGARSLDLPGARSSVLVPALRAPADEDPNSAQLVPYRKPHRVLAETNSSTGGRSSNSNASTSASSPALSPASSPSNSRHSSRGRKVRSWILGFFVGVVVGILTGAISSVLFRLIVDIVRGRFRSPAGPNIFSPQLRNEDLAFLEKEDSLSSLEMIGRGGCGEVYRATLTDENGQPTRVLAVKKISKFTPSDATSELPEEESRLLDKRMRQLRSEIQTVGHVRHRNLLPLLAHVPRADCNLLVYEFMKNGSLQDVLRRAVTDPENHAFPWPARLRVARGVAAGLEYLHTQHSPRIIHRDLKPGNILLDDSMEARIADFGLAKTVPDANTHMTTSNVAGTVGYIAPEYHQLLKFTDKCDVYSFGIILAVLVLGKMPSDDFFQDTEEMSLVKWLRNVMAAGEKRAVAAVDENLRGQGCEAQMLLVLKIACFCTMDDPKDRPGSKEVGAMLAQVDREQPPATANNGNGLVTTVIHEL